MQYDKVKVNGEWLFVKKLEEYDCFIPQRITEYFLDSTEETQDKPNQCIIGISEG
jgi:hypothetical protein